MKRVLVVDDSMYMRALICDALTKAGYTIVGQAATGEDAIAMTLLHDPDLITLDNILPDMIGIDILRTLKQEKGVRSKVVMVSAVGQEPVVQEGLGLGASQYLVKPFTNEGLVSAVSNALLD